jgi:diketogulonate reductase-like aldo/keto reductase
MPEKTLLVDGVAVPRLVYGTAWKEDHTQGLVEMALGEGFRGIDTANQRRHYHEAGVGLALRAAFEAGQVARDQLFLQTKFTFQPGQDHRLPYDPAAPIGEQVAQSFASSLEHLGVERIDSYVLHGPSRRIGLGPEDWEAWQAMEALQQSGHARWLGVSNISLEQLAALCQRARVMPRFVQNRCFAVNGWDFAVRQFCAERQIVYQGFSLLTANRDVVASAELGQIARRHGRTPCQVVFGFALAVGMQPLTGTTSAAHMREDLAAFDFELTPDEVSRIERLVCAREQLKHKVVGRRTLTLPSP